MFTGVLADALDLEGGVDERHEIQNDAAQWFLGAVVPVAREGERPDVGSCDLSLMNEQLLSLTEPSLNDGAM